MSKSNVAPIPKNRAKFDAMARICIIQFKSRQLEENLYIPD